jgi:transcriptional regulator with XRE-family HTH domain
MEFQQTLGQRIKAVRLAEQKSQADFSDALKISAAYLSQIETDSRDPSATLLELISCRFGIRSEWLCDGHGGPLLQEAPKIKAQKPLSKADIFKRDALITACVLGPVAPIISGGIAIGIGTAHILSKMCNAYKVNNAAKLAGKLGVDKSTIKLWLEKDRIPEKHIHKALNDTELTPKDLMTNNNLALIDTSILHKLLTKLWEEKFNSILSDQEFSKLVESCKK